MSNRATLKHLILIISALSVFAFASCSPNQQDAISTGDQTLNKSTLVAHLQAEGQTVEAAGTIEQPFFSVTGEVLEMNGQEFQVFEYDSEEMRSIDSDQIMPDGSVGTSMISWIDTPNFWASGRLIVLYVGSDPDTIDTLTQFMGEKINQ